MGGRGAGTGKVVPYDKWQEMPIRKYLPNEEVIDENGDTQKLVYIEDRRLHTNEPDIRPVTLAETIKEAQSWLNDVTKENGKNFYTYGDDDIHIWVQYKDGSHWDNDTNWGEKMKITGIVGVSVSTGDYEQVAGYEIYKGEKIPLRTWSEDGESGKTNSYSGYKTTESWWERWKVTQRRGANGHFYVDKTEVLKRSTKKTY